MTATASTRSAATPSTPSGLDRAAARTVLVDAVALVLDVAAAGLTDDTRLVEDLGADSLALVEIVEVTEERLLPDARPGFAIADQDIESLETIGVFADYLAARV